MEKEMIKKFKLLYVQLINICKYLKHNYLIYIYIIYFHYFYYV